MLVAGAGLTPAGVSSAGAQDRERERATQTERVTRNVNLGANGELELSNIAGDILITRSGGSAATIEVVKTGRGASDDEARAMLPLVQVEITERGTRAEVRTQYPSGDEWRRNNRRNVNVSVAYTVAAPEGTRIVVKSISGKHQRSRDHRRVDARNGQRRRTHRQRRTDGRAAARSPADIELVDTKVEGALEAGTISGTVRLRRLTARSIAVNSVSGDIEMDDVDAERTTGQVISGNITFIGDLMPNGRYEFTSHSGDVRVAVAPGAGFQVEATSFSGSISSDIPVTTQGGQNGRRNRTLRGTVGNGGAVLDLTTFSGSIVITKR